MLATFEGAVRFNSDLSAWNPSNVETMESMFEFAASFNSDLGAWNVAKVQNADNFLFLGTEFNQNLCAWGPQLAGNAAAVGDMFSGTFCPDQGVVNLGASPPGPFCFTCT